MSRFFLIVAGVLLVLAVLLTNRFDDEGSPLGGDSVALGRDGHRDQVHGSPQRPGASSKSQHRSDGVRTSRAKAWMLADAIKRCFPERRAVFTEQAKYRVLEESGAGEWKITGYADEDSLEVFTRLNTREGIVEVFAGIHADTGDDSFSTESPGHNLVVNLLVSENKRYSEEAEGRVDEATTYPLSFRLTVNRR